MKSSHQCLAPYLIKIIGGGQHSTEVEFGTAAPGSNPGSYFLDMIFSLYFLVCEQYREIESI